MKKYIIEGIASGIYIYLIYALLSNGIREGVSALEGIFYGLLVFGFVKHTGAHINPIVTLSLWSVDKIKLKDAGKYILAQTIGAIVAILVGITILESTPQVLVKTNAQVFIAEIFGTALFTFFLASVYFKEYKEETAGAIAGLALFFGIAFASLTGSSGILNPLVALALGSLSPVYFLSPILGGIGGMWLYRKLCVD